MIPVEKNDVDVSKLFRWGQKFELNWMKEKKEVYIRLVGDAELNQSRVFGLRKSAELRRKLADYNSEERLAFIPDYQTVTKTGLIISILRYTKEDFTEEAIKNVVIPVPKELSSEATLEEQEQHQKEIDDYPKIREKELLIYITDKIKSRETDLNKLSKKDLYDNFAVLAINEVCRNEFIKHFRSKCVYFGTYKDEEYKEKFFKSYEEFDNVPTEIKTQLINNYVSLEISMEDLKA